MQISSFQYVLWWAAILLRAVILSRALTQNLFRRYPLFFSYLSYGLFKSVALFTVHTYSPKTYPVLYWPCEFVDVALGFFIIWEICRQVFAKSPGIARSARSVLLSLFVLLVVYALLGSLDIQPWPQSAVGVLERNIRAVQLVLLGVVIVLLSYYLIPLGRNTKGMIIGYGLFISATIADYAIRHYFGSRFHVQFNSLLLLTYDIALIIWCGAFWSYQPDPVSGEEVLMEEDYQRLVSVANRAISNLRAYVLGQERS